MHAYSLSCVQFFETPWTVTHQAPLSIRFLRQAYWSRLLFPSPGDLLKPGTEPGSSALAGRFFTVWVTRETHACILGLFICVLIFATPWTVACRLLCPWDFPSKNTGVGCHPVLQGIFLTQGSSPHLLHFLHCRWILYWWAPGEAQGSPVIPKY